MLIFTGNNQSRVIRQMLSLLSLAACAMVSWTATATAAAAAAGPPSPIDLIGHDHHGQPRRAPNVLLILADDLGYSDLGVQGNRSIPTPHIDDLARRGVHFTQWLSASSICSPSRGSFLTGRFPHRIGLSSSHFTTRVFSPVSPGGLPLEEYTLAEALRDRGYSTHMTGKWHLGIGFNHEYLPTEQGFDTFFGLPLTNVQSCDPNKTIYVQDSLLEYVWEHPSSGGVLRAAAACCAAYIVYAAAAEAKHHVNDRATKPRQERGGSMGSRTLPRVVPPLALALLRRAVAAGGVWLLLVWCVWFYAGTFTLLNRSMCILIKDKTIIEQPFQLRGLTQRLVRDARRFIASHSSPVSPSPQSKHNRHRERDSNQDCGVGGSEHGEVDAYEEDGSTQGLHSTDEGFTTPSGPPPWMLYMATTKVHTALEVDAMFRGVSGAGLYGDAVVELDWLVGQLVEELRAADALDDTLIVFTSDNGPYLEKGVEGGSATGLRGGKGQIWEGGIRVPGIISYPAVLPSNVSTWQPFSSLDVFPTVLSLVDRKEAKRTDGGPDGLNPQQGFDHNPPAPYLDGVDLSDWLRGLGDSAGRGEGSGEEGEGKEEGEEEGGGLNYHALGAMVHYCGEEVAAVRLRGRYKIVWTSPLTEPGHAGCPSQAVCSCVGHRHEPPLLFDLLLDKAESLNLLQPKSNSKTNSDLSSESENENEERNVSEQALEHQHRQRLYYRNLVAEAARVRAEHEASYETERGRKRRNQIKRLWNPFYYPCGNWADFPKCSVASNTQTKAGELESD